MVNTSNIGLTDYNRTSKAKLHNCTNTITKNKDDVGIDRQPGRHTHRLLDRLTKITFTLRTHSCVYHGFKGLQVIKHSRQILRKVYVFGLVKL